MRDKLVATGAYVVLVLGLGPAIVACSGGIDSSPYAAQFNADLNRCENLSNSQMKTSCSMKVMNHYNRLMQREKKNAKLKQEILDQQRPGGS